MPPWLEYLQGLWLKVLPSGAQLLALAETDCDVANTLRLNDCLVFLYMIVAEALPKGDISHAVLMIYSSSTSALRDIDLVLHGGIKRILHLPLCTTDCLLYIHKRNGGLHFPWLTGSPCRSGSALFAQVFNFLTLRTPWYSSWWVSVAGRDGCGI